MTTLFFRDWRLFALAVGMLVVLGAAALSTIGRQEDPTITNLFATIVTPYPGADPARVESLVTEKIEEELREIAEIDEITSTSSSGVSVVQVELSEFISDTEIEQAWSEIRDALVDAARTLPAGVPEPEFDNDRTGAFTAISSVTARQGREVPLSILRRSAERLQDRLRRMPGTELVRVYGAPSEEILVRIDQQRLTSVGLTAEAVSQAIANGDSKVPAGQLRGTALNLLVEVDGEIDSLARVRNIALVEGRDGRILRVGDIAEVSRSLAEPPSGIAYADGERAILVAAKMEEGLQVDNWAERLRRELAAFEESLPDGLSHTLVFDQSGYTANRLNDLIGNMAIGIAIVVVVVLLTLGWRGAIIVGAVLPLTSLGTIAVLQAAGVAIHQMSVTGLIVALGLLVDAAIVMVDQVRHRLKEGKDREAAVAGAVRRLAVPLFASTVTTVLAFLPMALLPGPAGDFVGSIALSVIVMLIVSFGLALTITPALAGWMLPRHERSDGFAWLQHGLDLPAARRIFERSLDLSLRHRWLAILAAAALPLIGFGAFPTLTAQFFPGVERDQFYVQLNAPRLASIRETERQVLAADALLREDERVAKVDWVIGESAPAFYYNMMMNQDGQPTFAEALVTTVSTEAAEALIPDLQARFDEALPQSQVLVRDLVQGPPVNAPVELRLFGPDLSELRSLGEEIRRRMVEVADITHTRTSLSSGAPQLTFDLSEARVRLAGLEMGSVARQLDTLLEGAVGGSLVEGSEELPVRVRVGQDTRSSLAEIANMEVLGPQAALRVSEGGYPAVPLSALGRTLLEPAETPITRRDGERVNTVQGYIRLGVLPEEALQQVQDALERSPVALPIGYRLEVGGDADARQETVNNLISTLGLVVTLTVATIVLTFRSFRLSLVAGAVSLLAVGLSLLCLAIFDYPFGIQALIGVIGSIGVSINAAIIIMTGLQADPEAARGDPIRMREVVAGSSRHILSTTITTFGGFLPLILAGGGFWPPFAMAIAGGVLLSSIVSFYFTPPMFSLVTGRPRPPEPRRSAEPSLEPQLQAAQ